MTRTERAVVAARFRRVGLLQREIAGRMGISPSYAAALLNDPDGSKERKRKDSYRRPCPDCGRLMSGSDGRGIDAPQKCAPCYRDWQATEEWRLAHTLWTRERVIAAIRAFADEFGESPAIADWNPTQATMFGDHARARLAEERIASGEWPWFTLVVSRFGSWNAGIIAAGYEPRVRGGGGENILRRRDQRARVAA